MEQNFLFPRLTSVVCVSRANSAQANICTSKSINCFFLYCINWKTITCFLPNVGGKKAGIIENKGLIGETEGIC